MLTKKEIIVTPIFVSNIFVLNNFYSNIRKVMEFILH